MNLKLQQKLLKLSRSLIECPNGNHKHFSFLLLRNSVLSIGWNNSWKSHPLSKKYGHRFDSIHSELHCLLNCTLQPRELRYCTLVNVRLLKNLEVATSKPCKYCEKLLSDFNVSKVFYTNNLGQFKEL